MKSRSDHTRDTQGGGATETERMGCNERIILCNCRINICLYNEHFLFVTNQCSLIASLKTHCSKAQTMGLPWSVNTTVHGQIPWYYHCEYCKWVLHDTTVILPWYLRCFTVYCYGKIPWYYHCEYCKWVLHDTTVILPWYLRCFTVYCYGKIPWYYHCEYCKWVLHDTTVILPWYLRCFTVYCYGKIPWYYHCEYCKWVLHDTTVILPWYLRCFTVYCYGKIPWYYHCDNYDLNYEIQIKSNRLPNIKAAIYCFV